MDDAPESSAEPTALPPDEQAHFTAGLNAFNGGDFYGAHDHFEALWGDDFWKGLVQASVALHHHRIGNAAGLAGLPERVREVLAPYLPTHMGIDVARFLREFTEFMATTRPGAPEGGALAPRLHRVDNA